MWWLIYFAYSVLISVVIFFDSLGHIINGKGFNLIDSIFIINFIFATYGLYCYLTKKKILSFGFWRIYFWANLVFDIIYLLYELFPHNYLLQSLSFLARTPVRFSPIFYIIMSLLDIPFLYAFYQLSKGRFRKINKIKNI